MKRSPVIPLVLFGLLAFPQCAWANAGTLLVWAGFLHLTIGNTIIGAVEGLFISQLLGKSKVKTIIIMIAANYASSWIGGFFIRSAIVESLSLDLLNGWKWFWLMVVVTWFLTVILEWPFIAWMIRGTQHWKRRSFKVSLCIQTGSYALLFVWYWLASVTSLYTTTTIVSPKDLSLPESVIVYYISLKDGDVYERTLVGQNEEKIYELNSMDDNDRLFVMPSQGDTNHWDLMARIETDLSGKPKLLTVLSNLPVVAAFDWSEIRKDANDYPESWGNSGNYGMVQRLGNATNSQWKAWAGIWPAEGLRCWNEQTEQRVRMAYETPFGMWYVRNAVQLPSDKFLFQLGDDQICAFDPVSRRVALLWRGRGQVPVLARMGAEEVDATNEVIKTKN